MLPSVAEEITYTTNENRPTDISPNHRVMELKMHIWSNSGRIQLRELLWQVTFPRKKFILDFFRYVFVQVTMEKKSARISPEVCWYLLW